MYCRLWRFTSVLYAALGLTGCLLCAGCGASYATPGRGADLKALSHREALTDASITATLAKKPLATLPCGIAAVRIQASGYQSDSADTYGTGNYCVVTTRDVESGANMGRIAKWPKVVGVASLSRLLLPEKLNSDLELREGAASLRADMLLVYTIDTTFQVEDHLSPLTVATLGLSPNITAQIVTTASAVLMDTRNGYIYGFAEATEHGAQLTNGWMTEQAVNDARKRAEARAFGKLVDNLERTWVGVLKNMDEIKNEPPVADAGVNAPETHSAPPAKWTVLGQTPNATNPSTTAPADQAQIATPLETIPQSHSLGGRQNVGMGSNPSHFAAGGAIDPLTGATVIALGGLAIGCKRRNRA